MNTYRSVCINSRVIAAVLALLTAAAALLCGCSKDYKGFDDSGMPKAASDKAILAKWDEYPILKSVPRYEGGGVFDVIAEPSGDAVNVYYNGTSREDYEVYNALLKQTGFKLKEGSDIWSAEGSLGVPQYVKGEIQVTLVWNASGSLAICVAYS